VACTTVLDRAALRIGYGPDMLTVGVIQPCYLPWRGFFDFVNEVDTFVFLDDVQYTVRDWRSRNRIRTPGHGCTWLTVPVLGGRDQLIKDVRIDRSQPWVRKHLGAITQSYGRSPHFERYFAALSSALKSGHELLSNLDIELTRSICAELGIRTPLLQSSTLDCPGTKDDKLIAIVRAVGGQRYVSGPAAKAYLQPQKWQSAGIELAYKDYSGYPEYPQIEAPFEPSVSIIDLLFAVGDRAADYIWGSLRSRAAS
jgi:hypothetical protein